MPSVVHAWRGSEVLRAGFLLTALNIANGAMGYVFQVVMGRALAAEDYAAFNALLAMGMVACSPMAALEAVIARHVANVAARIGLGAVRTLYRTWTTWLWAFCSVAAGLILYAGPTVQVWLRIPDIECVWLLTGVVFATTLSILAGAVLRGLHAFAWIGGLGFGGTLVKIAICLLCVVSFHQGLRGALAGVLASVLLVFAISLWAIARRWPDVCPGVVGKLAFPFRLVPPVMASAIGLTVMTQIDLVLVGRFFNPATAGQYAPASILGKAVLYLPGGLVTAILPIVAATHARSEKSSGHAFQAIIATVLLCGAGALFYFVAGPWLVHLLYGDKYGVAGGLLALYGLAMVPMALAMVIQGFLVAKGRMLFCWVTAALAVLEMFVMRGWHPSLQAVIGTITVFNTALAVAGGILMVPEFRASTGSPDEA
jgi:O-antigen/teichoic acid export membrane protein